jgi:Domain of unknown function (DUF4190)
MSTPPPWEQPDATSPGWSEPGRAHPGWDQPGWDQPGWDQPGWDQPGWAPPSVAQPGWGQPGSAAGGWAPAGYGQPDATPPPPWASRRPTNALAVVSLVLAFVCAPAGLVLGIVARRQIRRTGEEGAGLALAGIVVGSLWTGLLAALLVVWLVALSMLAHGFAP